ncbi:Ig-like domain-containing protein [Vibrio parahaemolyticus]|uniref:Ig-like domain-containing protein n=1 Tax=Vibrio parahaemolyticus TaxID=670 RepID=UPI00226AD2B7|nr:Ig-like domain-containing protein [Vibrio parahaemolyticus]MCX8795896.1 Ig-like domain-containing protein [Vibrio parahaemolyticus]
MKKLAILSLSVLASTASFGALASNFYVQLMEDTDSGLSTKDAVTSVSTPTFKFKARHDSVFNYTLENKTTGDSTADSVLLPRFSSTRIIKFPYLADGKYQMTYRNTNNSPQIKTLNFVIDTSVEAFKVEHHLSGNEVIFTSKVEPDSLFEVSYYPEGSSMAQVGALTTSDSNDGYVSVTLPLIMSESTYTVTYRVTDKAGNKKTTSEVLRNF